MKTQEVRKIMIVYVDTVRNLAARAANATPTKNTEGSLTLDT